MTLTTRIAALVLLALVPSIAVQAYNERALRTAREEAVHASALRYAQAAADDLAQFANGARQVLDVLAEQPAIRDRDAAACTAILPATVAKVSGATGIAVTDAGGALVCNSAGAAPGAYSLADRGYFQATLSTRGPVFGEYIVGRTSGRPSIQYAHPLLGADGSISGILNIGFDPVWIGQRLAKAGLPRDATLTVSDRNGRILVRIPDAADWVGRDLPAVFRAGLDAVIASGGVGEMVGLRGRLRITGVVRPGNALDGMTVAVGLDRAASFADIDAATRRGVTLILLGTFGALAAALLGGRAFIRRPVQRLLRTARIWRSGDLSARADLFGTSEFGQIGEAFDAMAASLQANDRDLKAELARSRGLQEQQVTMLHELNHRVKNTLATVQSLARQSGGGEAQATQLEQRILSLSKTHDLLTRDDWTGASLREVLENELSPYAAAGELLPLDGPDIDLPPRYVLALGMTAHELTTNAAKYGALSVPGGRVNVAWRTATTEGGDRRLLVEWREEGGPAIALPTRRGFGTRLITGGIARELSGRVSLDFRPEGLACTIDVPLEPPASPLR